MIAKEQCRNKGGGQPGSINVCFSGRPRLQSPHLGLVTVLWPLLRAIYLSPASAFRLPRLPCVGRACTYFLFFREAHMGRKLYVGNLTYGVTDSTLQQLFAEFGTVQSAQVIMDRDTGRSK